MRDKVVELVTTKETYEEVLQYFERRGWGSGGMRNNGPYLYMALYPRARIVSGNYSHMYSPSFTYNPQEGITAEILEALNG